MLSFSSVINNINNKFSINMTAKQLSSNIGMLRLLLITFNKI